MAMMKKKAVVKKPVVKKLTTSRTGRSADAVAGSAAAKDKADSKLMTGTGSDYVYRVSNNRTTRPNAGKRISETRTEKGAVALRYSNGDMEMMPQTVTRRTSDSIVKPTIKKKPAAMRLADKKRPRKINR